MIIGISQYCQYSYTGGSRIERAKSVLRPMTCALATASTDCTWFRVYLCNDAMLHVLSTALADRLVVVTSAARPQSHGARCCHHCAALRRPPPAPPHPSSIDDVAGAQAHGICRHASTPPHVRIRHVLELSGRASSSWLPPSLCAHWYVAHASCTQSNIPIASVHNVACARAAHQRAVSLCVSTCRTLVPRVGMTEATRPQPQSIGHRPHPAWWNGRTEFSACCA